MKSLFAFCVMVLIGTSAAPALAQSDKAWIDDELYVPLRSGSGQEYRIVNRGLKSGTGVEIVAWPEDKDWAQVRYQGEKGWARKQYLSRSPTAQMKLEQLRQRFNDVQSALEQARNELGQLRKKRDQLAEKNETLQSDLQKARDRVANLEEVAAEPIRLDKANQKLNEQVSSLRTKLDQARAQNSMLRDDKTSQQWAMGAGILILGGILGWIFKARGNRGRGNWMN
jgi:SH3 domain protein